MKLNFPTQVAGKGEPEDFLPALATSTPLTSASATAVATPTLAASALSRNILREPRLNLSNTTLQRLRNPASLERFIPTCDGGVCLCAYFTPWLAE